MGCFFFLFLFYISACLFSFVFQLPIYFPFFLELSPYKMVLDTLLISILSVGNPTQSFATNHPSKFINCSAKVLCLG